MKKKILMMFNNFETGFVNERYISELDIMLYFGISILIYCIGIIFIFDSFFMINYWIKVIMTIPFIYLCFSFLANYIYSNAPLKKAWKNKEIKENKIAIAKRMKLQFIAFMVIAFMFGTSKQYTNFFYILIILFIITVFIKIYLLYKKEKSIHSI